MLTARQKECLDFIRSYTAKRGGEAPTYQDIMDALGLRSKAQAHGLIHRLIERGHVRHLYNRARALEVIHKQERWHYFVWNDETQKFVAWSPLRKASGQG